MKIRLEPEKTTLRISNAEFTVLLNEGTLSNMSALPGGENIEYRLSLKSQQFFHYGNNLFQIELPKQIIQSYKPNKIGLSFYFQLDNQEQHHFIFEVDIKKKPLKK